MTPWRWIAFIAGPFAAAAIAVYGASRPSDPACRIVAFEEARFTVCAFDPERHSLRLVTYNGQGRPLRSFASLARRLGEERARVRFAMNAGMFDAGGRPIGLYVEGGVQQQALNRTDGPGNFHLKPNGVFWLDADGPHVASSDSYAALQPDPVFATQSGPMLVIDGALHPTFDADGASRHLRNAVGVCGGKAEFAISETPVSFGRFARLFKDALGCRNALYLDGAVSSLWRPDIGRRDDHAALGPFVVVSDRP